MRTFLFCLPAFLLLSAVGLDQLIEMASKRWQKRWIEVALMLSIFLYANGTFFITYQRTSDFIANVLRTEDVDFIEFQDQRIVASVYMDHYSVRDVINELEKQRDLNLPIFLDSQNTRYDFALSTYLDAYGIDYQSIDNLGSIQIPQFYMFVSYAAKSEAELKTFFPGATCEAVSRTLSVYKAMKCEFNQ